MPVLGTKLHVPAIRRRLVPRPRLTGRLQGDPASWPRLVLVSAPAGFGKTTLLAGGLPAALELHGQAAAVQGRVASMNAAPRVGQAQSMIQVRSGPRRMFSGLKSVCGSASPSSRSRSALRSTYAAQRCRACFTGRSEQLIAASWCRASMTRGKSGEPGR
jgi:hypothetical protein